MNPTTIYNPIYLIHVTEGIVRVFHSYDDLLWRGSILPWNEIGPHFIKYNKSKYGDLGYYIFHNFILRDSFGDDICVHQAFSDFRTKHKRKRSNMKMWIDGSIAYKRRYGKRHFRHPIIMNEQRWHAAWEDEECAPSAGPRRKPLNEDWYSYDTRHKNKQRSWKKHREHQWKVVD